ncbi:MAG: PEP-CTERM sorting domain-containing protein [Sedimentisphaerales bacterium]|nr:PEP-CTERM sorting domain-containing protein [Sedimentisphaerales bacterium]
MRHKMLLIICVIAAFVGSAMADPVWVTTLQDPHQDSWTIDGEVEELSTAPHNREMQLISATDQPWSGEHPCPVDYDSALQLPDILVMITNQTNRFFKDLYYVGDVHDDGSFETTFTNYDELVADITPYHNNNAPGLAFKIDAVGANQPLVFESMTPDQVFEPGETWHFVIQQYSNMFGLPASALGSVGPTPWGAVAQASMMDTVSSGSIITPEPTTLCLLALSGVAILRRKK